MDETAEPRSRRSLVLATVGAALAVLVVIVVTAVVTGRDDDEPEPGPSPSPTETAASTEPLAGFPLTLGYPETNGSDGSLVEVTDKPGVGAIPICGEVAWDPAVDTSDLIGAEYVGEAEDFRGRTLVLYASDEAAATAVEAMTTAVEACPEEQSDDESGGASLYEIIDSDLGDESVAWTTIYRDPQGLTGTGLTVNHMVRVGSALFVAYEYGEGAGSPESMDAAIQHATEQAEAIVEEMSAL
jgi:hypothetical protein